METYDRQDLGLYMDLFVLIQSQECLPCHQNISAQVLNRQAEPLKVHVLLKQESKILLFVWKSSSQGNYKIFIKLKVKKLK